MQEVDEDPTAPVVERVGPWLLGLVVALVVVGPGLAPGSWFNVDLVVTPVTPVPRGVWGLGPEFPRRVPYALPLAWASVLMDSTWATKAMVLASITAAVAGAWRLAGRWAPDTVPLARAGAGLLYGASPFLLTRLGVGHLPLVVAMAVLPWAMPSLLAPTRSGARTYLWALALGCTGFFGGTLAIPAVLAGLVAAPAPRRAARTVGLLALSQAPWLVPGLVVLAQATQPAASADFRTSGSGPGGVLRVLAGHGFWRTPSQVGVDQGWSVALIGVGLAVLAVFGLRAFVPDVRRAAAVAAAIGLAVPLASAVPLVRRLYAVAVDTPVSAVLREGQRLLPLYLVVMAPAVAAAATRLARALPGWREGVVLVAPLAAALVLAGPGLWGVGGSLDPARIPDEWERARAVVRAEGGTVLSLPFFQYSYLGVADDRVSLDPMPIFLGGDVLASSDPGLSTASRERSDAREDGARRVVARSRTGRPVAGDLAELGVRWVVVRHDRDWTSYLSLGTDPGLRRVVAGPTLDLYRVEPWVGPVLGADGAPVDLSPVVAPLARLDASDRATWHRPWARGWMRGWESAGSTPWGTVDLPAGSGPVWFWPAAVVLLADAAAVAAGVMALRRVRATRRGA